MTKEKQVKRLDPQLRKVLHIISLVASFSIVWSILAIGQALTVGMIPGVWDVTIGKISVAPIIFSIVAALIALKCGKYSSPYV